MNRSFDLLARAKQGRVAMDPLVPLLELDLLDAEIIEYDDKISVYVVKFQFKIF